MTVPKYPRKSYIYMALGTLCAALLFGNILATDHWTAETPFREFSRREWRLFFLFLLSEAAIGALLCLCAFRLSRITAARKEQFEQAFAPFRYAGIHPDEYAFVWFDCSGKARARITRLDNGYCAHVDAFDWQTERWTPCGAVEGDTLEDVQDALRHRFRFLCEENIDSEGN